MSCANSLCLLSSLCAVFMLTGCSTGQHSPVECRQIRTVSYETGVITTSLRLSPQPSVDDVLRCFGSPDAYHIARLNVPDNTGFAFALFYPRKGLTFSSHFPRKCE